MKIKLSILAVVLILGVYVVVCLSDQNAEYGIVSDSDALQQGKKLLPTTDGERSGFASIADDRLPLAPRATFRKVPAKVDWKSDKFNYAASSILMFDDFGLLTSQFQEYYGLTDLDVAYLDGVIAGIDQEIFSIESAIKSENYDAFGRRITLNIPQYIREGGGLFDRFGQEFKGVMGPERYNIFVTNSESTIERRFCGFGKFNQEVTLILPTTVDPKVSIHAKLTVPGAEISLQDTTIHQTADSLDALGASLLPYSWLTHLHIGQARSLSRGSGS